jgi:hypothetical protein
MSWTKIDIVDDECNSDIFERCKEWNFFKVNLDYSRYSSRKDYQYARLAVSKFLLKLFFKNHSSDFPYFFHFIDPEPDEECQYLFRAALDDEKIEIQKYKRGICIYYEDDDTRLYIFDKLLVNIVVKALQNTYRPLLELGKKVTQFESLKKAVKNLIKEYEIEGSFYLKNGNQFEDIFKLSETISEKLLKENDKWNKVTGRENIAEFDKLLCTVPSHPPDNIPHHLLILFLVFTKPGDWKKAIGGDEYVRWVRDKAIKMRTNCFEMCPGRIVDEYKFDPHLYA